MAAVLGEYVSRPHGALDDLAQYFHIVSSILQRDEVAVFIGERQENDISAGAAAAQPTLHETKDMAKAVVILAVSPGGHGFLGQVLTDALHINTDAFGISRKSGHKSTIQSYVFHNKYFVFI